MANTALLAPTPDYIKPLTIDLAGLRRAVRNRMKVRFRYTDILGAASERTVRPLSLAFFGPVWMLAAWCELQGKFPHVPARSHRGTGGFGREVSAGARQDAARFPQAAGNLDALVAAQSGRRRGVNRLRKRLRGLSWLSRRFTLNSSSLVMLGTRGGPGMVTVVATLCFDNGTSHAVGWAGSGYRTLNIKDAVPALRGRCGRRIRCSRRRTGGCRRGSIPGRGWTGPPGSGGRARRTAWCLRSRRVP